MTGRGSVLVFPRSGPGALNISRGDVARLEPGEFLNDTLIEFWLKCVSLPLPPTLLTARARRYWLSMLRASQDAGTRALAEEIHVFSSFFYKKLNQRKYASSVPPSPS